MSSASINISKRRSALAIIASAGRNLCDQAPKAVQKAATRINTRPHSLCTGPSFLS